MSITREILKSAAFAFMACVLAKYLLHPSISELAYISIAGFVLFQLRRRVANAADSILHRFVQNFFTNKTSGVLLILLLLGVSVGIPNLSNIFATDFLLQDDWMFILNINHTTFFEAMKGTIFHFNSLLDGSDNSALSRFVRDCMYMQTRFFALFTYFYGYAFAKFLMLILLYIPCSYGMFLFLRKVFGFPFMEAFIASVIPLILPLQHEIMSAVNLSYVVCGVLAFWLSMFFAAKFLSSETSTGCSFLLFIFIFTAGNLFVGGEQMMLALPSVVFFVVFYSKKWRRKLWFLLPLGINISIGLFRWMQLRPPVNTHAASIPLDTCIHRVCVYLNYLSPCPLSGGPDGLLPGMITTVALLGLACFFLVRKWSGSGNRAIYDKQAELFVVGKNYFILLFSLSIMVFSVAPFLTVSPYMVVRSLLFSGLGFWILAAITFGFLFKKCASLLHCRAVGIMLLVGLIVLSGSLHMRRVERYFRKGNRDYYALRTALTTLPTPPKCQIAIIGDIPFYATHPNFTFRGFIAYERKYRSDIGGAFFAKHEYFREVFSSEELIAYMPRGAMIWLPFKNGQYNTDGVRIYNYDKSESVPATNRMREYKYFLRVKKPLNVIRTWKKMDRNIEMDNTADNEWSLYRSAGVGKWALWMQGQGEDSYRNALKQQIAQVGVRPEDIAWGNPADEIK